MTDAGSSFADAIRKTCEAYSEAVSTITKGIEAMPATGGEAQRRMVDQWLGLARMSKESFVTALNQTFDLWERECRRLAGGPATSPLPPWTNPLEAWSENWRRSMETFLAASRPGDFWAEQARRQTEMVQQTLEEGLRAWQRLWQVPGANAKHS